MTIPPAVLDALLAAGATAEMIVAAVKADAEQDAARKAEKRAGDRERQSRKRARDRASHAPSQDVTHVTRDIGDTLSLPPSPQTPQPPTHTRGGVTTHAYEADDWPEGETATDHAARLATINHNIDAARRPGLITSLGEVARWRQQGWSWQLDVLPIVRAHGQRAGPDPVSTWKFFTEAIGRAHAARTRPPETYDPQVRHERTGSRPPREAAYADRLSDIDRAMAAACE